MIRKTVVMGVIAFASMGAFAQVGINAGGNAPDASAMLDVSATDKGFLPPRMTTSQRDAISNPALGLVVFNTDNKCLNLFVGGGQWNEVCGVCAPQPTTASAGSDQLNLSGTTTTLVANTPSSGMGVWTIVSGSGGSVTTANDPASGFSGVGGNTYTLRWTISTGCGSSYDEVDVSFVNPYTCGDPITDYDGNSYSTLAYGSQCWMIQNLKTEHYNNGDVIPNVTDNTIWQNLTTGAMCAYDNNNSNISLYGLMYNWYAVDDLRGICPIGWHVPTDEEWKTLEMHLGMSQVQADAENDPDRNPPLGTQMRTASGWSPTNGTNTTQFSVVPGGYRNSGFSNGTSGGYIWTSTSFDADKAWYRMFYYYYSGVGRMNDYGLRKYTGESVRCILD